MVYKKYQFGFLTSSNKEIFDILKAWVAVSIAFGIVLGGLTRQFFSSFVISVIAVGFGFLLHELMHKYFAQKYGYRAEFRSFDEMLFLGIILAVLFRFVIAAPGAVMIESYRYDIKKNGIISIAGPVTNLILAILFFALLQFSSGFLNTVADYGFRINTILALFNMIPFWMFDGAKVWKWNKFAWGLVVVIGVGFIFLF